MVDVALKRILDLCERRGFIKRVFSNNKVEQLKSGPTGSLLQQNLKTEWDTYEYAKELSEAKSPFGIAETLPQCENDKEEFQKFFLRDCEFLLRTTMFVAPSDSTHFFHRWQRQRRTWWRKFSAAPGRYVLTEIKNTSDTCQTVEIMADYSWGPQLIESIKLSSAPPECLNSEDLHMQDGQKNVHAHHIVSNISLSSTVLNALCDAYDEPLFHGKPRAMLRLHRKLAPYKISFSIDALEAATKEELGELALYLCRKLRSSQISCLLIPSLASSAVEPQWCHYDQLGVPYTIVLNEGTLKNGIAGLRSRDTTLQEQVHISNLPGYVEQIFKNY